MDAAFVLTTADVGQVPASQDATDLETAFRLLVETHRGFRIDRPAPTTYLRDVPRREGRGHGGVHQGGALPDPLPLPDRAGEVSLRRIAG